MEEKKKIGVGFGVMILKDNKVLLGKRHSDPKKADSKLHGEGTWTMPGGKLEYGETFEDGAIREVKEETNLQLKSIKIIAVNNDMNEFAHFVTIGMLSTDFTGAPKVMEPDEITEWAWFDLNSLPRHLYFPSAKLIENHKQRKFYIVPGEKKQKLVRDRIPEIYALQKNHIADDKEYLRELQGKLREEAEEFIESNDVEELADILEVVYALSEHCRTSPAELEKMRKDKAEKRGAFKKRQIWEMD
jgi:8-oxo-dGTP diphosphatase